PPNQKRRNAPQNSPHKATPNSFWGGSIFDANRGSGFGANQQWGAISAICAINPIPINAASSVASVNLARRRAVAMVIVIDGPRGQAMRA
ncbi:hypothetical protein, partial [Cupriavidus metallidurans]